MIGQIKIRLTTPMLGSKFSKEKIRRFERLNNGDIKINRTEWVKALEEAETICNSTLDVGSIILPEGFRSPTLRIYRRTYNRSKVELFESIQQNTIVTFDFASKKNDEDVPAKLETVFKTVGSFIGLSEWGAKFGFGRFEICQVTKQQ